MPGVSNVEGAALVAVELARECVRLGALRALSPASGDFAVVLAGVLRGTLEPAGFGLAFADSGPAGAGVGPAGAGVGPAGRAAGGGRRCPAEFRPAFRAAASATGLPVELLEAVAEAESGFDPRAVSRAGAVGLMQLMPATARALGVSDPFDPWQNVLAGARYLRSLLDRFGSLELALAAYNAGPGAVERYGGIPPYPETRAYVAKVVALFRQRGGGVC